MNASIFWSAFVRRRKSPSWIPIIGGLCGAISLAIVPLPGAKWWWWLPLILDWGSIPGILVSLIYIFTRSRRGTQHNEH
jgi:hypothetical protein